MKKHLIVTEPRGFFGLFAGFAGMCLHGCNRSGVEKNMPEAIAIHLDGWREDGLPVPIEPNLTAGTSNCLHKKNAPVLPEAFFLTLNFLLLL